MVFENTLQFFMNEMHKYINNIIVTWCCFITNFGITF